MLYAVAKCHKQLYGQPYYSFSIINFVENHTPLQRNGMTAIPKIRESVYLPWITVKGEGKSRPSQVYIE